jgi:hypothetical protein
MFNFFTLFYTHKYHLYNSFSIGSWVLLNNKVYQTKPNQKNENQLELSCYINSSNNDKLSIDINDAYIYTDCSLPITSDKPVPCSNTSLPGNYKLYNFNIINAASVTETQYDVMSSNIIKVYPYYNVGLNANYQNVKLNVSNNVSNITLSNVPYGNKIIKRYRDNLLISYALDNTLDTGYLPNEYLNNDINESLYSVVDLYTWSIALLSLIEYKEDLLIYKALVSIINVYKSNYANTSVEGLPDSLEENTINNNKLQRDVLKNAWAGYCILQAIGYLTNRPTNLIVNLPSDITLLLKSIVTLIQDCLNINGLIIGYDAYGGKIDNLSISATFITDIFLNQYLCYFYDFDVHSSHNIIHKFCIESIYINYKNLDYITNNLIDINTYKSLWIFYFNRSLEYTETIFNEIKQEINNNPTYTYDLNLLSFLYSKFISDEVITVDIPETDFDNLYTNYNDLYVSLDRSNQNLFLYLIDSSWGVLLQSETALLNPVNFKIDTDIINFETLDLLKSLTDSWPTGLKWTSYTSIYDTTTVIGSLFNAIAYITTDWSLLRHYMLDSFSCITSQGDSLDKWGALLNFYRPLYQADYYYRNTLLILLNRVTPTYNNLKSFIINFLEDTNVDITIKSFPPVYYKNSSNIWVSRPWVGNKADIDLINSQVNSDGYPCFYLPNLLNVMTLVPVHKYTGQVSITSSNIDLTNALIIKNLIVAGVTSNINSINTYSASDDYTSGLFSVITI